LGGEQHGNHEDVLISLPMGNSTFQEKTDGEWEFAATRAMFELKDSGQPWTADDFYRKCREIAMPAHLIKKFSGAMFRRYQSSGYIRQRKGEHRLSERNNSSLLAVWEAAS
jgi:hypothetical protein